MKRILYLSSILLFLLLTGCKKWLDIRPVGEVDADKMFETEAGFDQTLAGSYQLLDNTAAYGNELTVGFPEQIVHNWNTINSFSQFQYKNDDAQTTLRNTWLAVYKAIANTNLVLDHLDGKTSNDLRQFDIIKGEALGLRAYLHLDLLRIYGPVLKNGLDQPSIPYHEHFSNELVQRMPAKTVLSMIERDLLAAYALLKNDPINTYGRKSTATAAVNVPELAFNYRGIRMNYYAVAATLARYYLLIGDNVNALKYATEVINSGLFPLTTLNNAVTSQDFMFSTELVWSLFDQNIQVDLSNAFTLTAGTGAIITTDQTYKKWVYEDVHAAGSIKDYRGSLYWFTYNTSYFTFSRYLRSLDAAGNDISKYDKLIPMIRVSEMYHIAAEALIGTDNTTALGYLNAVRVSRSLPALPDTYASSNTDLMDQVVYDIQKDVWGEGKLFYLYKRLFRNIATQNNTFPATTSLFELPIPPDEIELGGN